MSSAKKGSRGTSRGATGRRGGRGGTGRRGGRGGRGGSARGNKLPTHEQPRGARNQPTAEAIAGGFVYKPIITEHGKEEKVITDAAGKASADIKERNELGIPDGSAQALVCQECMDKYTKAEEKKITTKTQTVQGHVQLSAGGARLAQAREVTTVEEETIVPGFRHCMKCFPELAKELPKDEGTHAYVCKKCLSGDLNKKFRCIKCQKPVGGKAGKGGAMICNRHSEPQRCFRCGEP